MRDDCIGSGCLYLMKSKSIKHLNLNVHIDKGILLRIYRNRRKLKWTVFDD